LHGYGQGVEGNSAFQELPIYHDAKARDSHFYIYANTASNMISTRVFFV